MTDTKPERLGAVERVKRFRHDVGDVKYLSILEVVRLIQEAEAALLEEACKAQCSYCRDGKYKAEIREGTWDSWMHWEGETFHPCSAGPTRRLME